LFLLATVFVSVDWQTMLNLVHVRI